MAVGVPKKTLDEFIKRQKSRKAAEKAKNKAVAPPRKLKKKK